MLTNDDADRMFDGLMEILSDPQFEGRLDALVAEVRSTIAQGRPAAAEVTIAGRRQRERVRQVVPLNAEERLRLVVRSIEMALVVPVDLASTTLSVLVTEEEPTFDLVFERDSAEAATESRSAAGQQTASTSDDERVVITASEMDRARSAIEPLRTALAAIR